MKWRLMNTSFTYGFLLHEHFFVHNDHLLSQGTKALDIIG